MTRVGVVWDAVGEVETGRDLLGAARAAGLDTFLVFDHLLNGFPRQAWDTDLTPLAAAVPDPDLNLDFATVLGNFASDAGAVRLAVGVTDPHRRHPAVLAQMAITLARLTERAPVLGIGTGAQLNLSPYGVPHDDAVGRVGEALAILRKFLTHPGPHDYRGRHFTLDHAVLGLRPPPGRVPEIWVGAAGPRMLRLTGRFADGWLPADLMTPPEYRDRLATVRSAAAEAGRDPASVTASGGVPIVVAESDAAARTMLDDNLLRFIALHANAAIWRALGHEHPFGEHYRGLHELLPHRLSRSEVTTALGQVPAEVVESRVLAGSPETVLGRLGELVDAGMELPMLIPASAVISPDAARFTVETIARLGAEIGPAVPGRVG